MPPVSIRPGVVFWPNGLPGDKTHPWFVISEIVGGKILAVNATDFFHYSDSACILEKIDHECLLKKSSVNYPERQEFDAKKLASELEKNRLLLHKPDLKAEVLERVLSGARCTRDMTDDIKIKYGIIPKPKPPGHPF
jgi:hypothetical protein